MSATTNVVRLVTRLNIGGPARQALLLTRELASQFPTTLVAGTPTSSEGELHDPAVAVVHVPLVRPLRPGADVRALMAVRRLMGKVGPALVHTHMAKAGALGRLAAMGTRSRPRTVHTFHGHVLDGYFGPRAQRAIIEVERRLARHTDVLLAVSPEVRDAVLSYGIGRPSQFQVVPLGLDLTRFLEVSGSSGQLRDQLGLGPAVPLVGVVGRLVPIKDHETLFGAITRLPGVHLAVIGDGELRRRLEVRARDLGIGERTHFTGWVRDVAAAVSDLDVVALTSRNEGTPVSLIEAAACARPVVATEVGGVPLIVKDGVTGYLSRPGHPDDVAGALRRALDSPEASRRLGQEGRRQVRDRFSHERLVRDISDLYTELLYSPSKIAHRYPK
ncbi:MAG: glycosyltransferase [Actinomycetota bacterium]|nr:glycosyltransferase [Actinomycetota bacterium]